jgi:hypothetical protein
VRRQIGVAFPELMLLGSSTGFSWIWSIRRSNCAKTDRWMTSPSPPF